MPQKPNPPPIAPPPLDRNSTAHISFLKLWGRNLWQVFLACLFTLTIGGVIMGLVLLVVYGSWQLFVGIGVVAVLVLTGCAAWVEKKV